MTLTELKYIIAVARERHFGRAAKACFVSQPTLSVAIKKLEEELGLQIFTRDTQDIQVTMIGEKIINQAQHVLEQAQIIRSLAQQGKDPLNGPVRFGLIYTIGPYILPELIPRMIATTPQMPLILRESLTAKLLEMLKQGELDCALLAEPFDTSGLTVVPLYKEPFVLAVPTHHPWAKRRRVAPSELAEQTVLLLGAGHCLREQILASCPNLSSFSQATNGIQKTFAGSSLETLRHMVASGLGITILPATAVPVLNAHGTPLRYIPFSHPAPGRRVTLAARKGFNRDAALDVLIKTLLQCTLPGTQRL